MALQFNQSSAERPSGIESIPRSKSISEDALDEHVLVVEEQHGGGGCEALRISGRKLKEFCDPNLKEVSGTCACLLWLRTLVVGGGGMSADAKQCGVAHQEKVPDARRQTGRKDGPLLQVSRVFFARLHHGR